MGRKIGRAVWYKRSNVGVLHSAFVRMEHTGITAHQGMSILARHASPPRALRHLGVIRNDFQRQVWTELLARHRPDEETRMRIKLARWRFDGIPHVCAERALRQLSALRTLVPPQATVAVLSTM